jgi:poly-gamma-glutamate synthesis protein (capsule biosynthesis protein)
MPSKNNKTIIINAVGDIMLSGKIGEKINDKKTGYLFDKVRHILAESDITIGNLENPLSDRGEKSIGKDFIFRASPNVAKPLKDSGINIVSLANNHILDYGPVALDDTISILKKVGISYAGAGENLKKACKPLFIETNNLKIAFLAFTYAYPARKNAPGCCPCDLKTIKKKISNAKKKSDLIIASIHHGIEYVDYPNKFIISLFRKAADYGANIVLGHHPHVPQGIEVYKDSLIAYSLGNFTSAAVDRDVRKTSYQKTAVAYFTDEPLDENDMRTTESFILRIKCNNSGVLDHKLIPIKINDEFQPTIMGESDAKKMLERINEISEKFANLNDPVWEKVNDLYDKCRQNSLKSIKFKMIGANLHKIRMKHLKLIPDYLRSKLPK